MRRIALCLALVLILGGCELAAAPTFEWDHRSSALIASLSKGGGLIPQMLRFTESRYGMEYTLLLGDGRVFQGTPAAARVRQLDEAEVQALLSEMRPDLVARHDGLSAHPSTDAPLSTLSVEVSGSPAARVTGYGLDGEPTTAQPPLPAELLHAAAALRQAAAGAVPVRPARLMIGAEKVPMPVGETPRSWPLAEVDLARAPLTDRPDQAVVLSGAQVDAVLPLLDKNPLGRGTLFSQGSELYLVGFCVVLF